MAAIEQSEKRLGIPQTSTRAPGRYLLAIYFDNFTK